MSSPNQKDTGLSPEHLAQIAAIVAQAIKAANEPTEEEAEDLARRKAEREQDKKQRRERGQEELRRIENRKAEQAMCPHLRADGTTHTVHIFGSNNLNDYMICQGCGAFIHAEPRPTEGPLAKEFENHIFDTRMFNLHYRMSTARTTY